MAGAGGRVTLASMPHLLFKCSEHPHHPLISLVGMNGVPTAGGGEGLLKMLSMPKSYIPNLDPLEAGPGRCQTATMTGVVGPGPPQLQLGHDATDICSFCLSTPGLRAKTKHKQHFLACRKV